MDALERNSGHWAKAFSSAEHVLFGEPRWRSESVVRYCLIAVLLLIGIAHWLFFFNLGRLSLNAYDWRKEASYLNTLRGAQLHSVFPWESTDADYQGTTKFLVNPEVGLTPDCFLLQWMGNSTFLLVHVLIFYSLGFVAMLLVARKVNANLIAVVFFWLVFNFNGYLTSHIAVGHIQWTGYFLLPFFFLELFQLLEESEKRWHAIISGPSLGLALLLGLLIWNGSIHIFVWCAMFTLLTVVWRPEIMCRVALVLISSSFLGCGRLLPAGLFFRHQARFLSGYPTFGTLLDGLTSLHVHDFANGGWWGGWWEYDIYVGFVAFVVLTVCLALALRRQPKPGYEMPVLAVGAVFSILSMGKVFGLIAYLPLPFASVERVSSRFIIMPFILILVLVTSGMDELFRRWPKNGKLAVVLALPFIAFELSLHSIKWQISSLEHSFGPVTNAKWSVGSGPDRLYVLSVYFGWFVSVASFLVVIALLLANRLRLSRIAQQASLNRG